MPDGLAFDTSAEALKGMKMLNLRTRFGDLDLTFSPAGFPGGYADLIGRAGKFRCGRFDDSGGRAAGPDSSKAAANRLKDQDALPELIRLARRADSGKDGGTPASPAGR
ncbi:MAG: hypothetical protein ACR2M5_03820 [Nakamurella sp.]